MFTSKYSQQKTSDSTQIVFSIHVSLNVHSHVGTLFWKFQVLKKLQPLEETSDVKWSPLIVFTVINCSGFLLQSANSAQNNNPQL